MAPLTFPCCRHCPGFFGSTCDQTRKMGKPHSMPCEECIKAEAADRRLGIPKKITHPSQKGKTT